MPKYEVHLAIADRIYALLGSEIIANPALFFCGNLAPDAYETRADYTRYDKLHTHMCEGEIVHSYGYGYPRMAVLFKKRVDEFAQKYCGHSDANRDLYLGYIAHLYTDEIYRVRSYELLEEHLISEGMITPEPDFRKNLADRVADGEYKEIFGKLSRPHKMSLNEYPFSQNIVEIFETDWNCEIKGYITAEDIIAFNGYVLSSIKDELAQDRAADGTAKTAIDFVDYCAKEIIARIAHLTHL